MNYGKKFETDFKKSVPQIDCYCYRFKDGTASWDGSNTRFQAFNICDFMVVNRDKTYLFELKSTQNTSLPFSAIRNTQISEMKDTFAYSFIYPAFIIFFRKKEKSYCIPAKKVISYMEDAERKSIPYAWCVDNGVELHGKKLKVNWKWDVERLLAEIGAENASNNSL